MVASVRFALSLTLTALIASLLSGCSREAENARAIQTQRQRQTQIQSERDHLGEGFNLLQRLVELNPEKAQRQIAYHLNRWLEERVDVVPGNAETPPPELLRTVSDLLADQTAVERATRQQYAPSDVDHLRDSYLFSRMVQWVDHERCDDPLLADWMARQEQDLGEELAYQLRTASRLFDWTVRNIAIEPAQSMDVEGAPPLPLGMEFEGPGYRQKDYQTLMRGTGDGLQRAGVFTQLCRQAKLPAFVLAIQQSGTGELQPWCVGVQIGTEVYLFEPNLGIFVPGPGQEGIATLAQARTDASVMRRLGVPGFFDYPLSKSDVQQNIALLNVIPEAVSGRMKTLQSGLTGQRRMVVYVDADQLAKDVDEASGIAGVRLWRIPLLAEYYEAAMQEQAERNPMFAFWYFSRWAILDASVSASENLALGRWRHLHGQFDNDERENVDGARTLYLAQRAPEFEIEKLDIDVELQKAYGIRRELGMSSEVYERQIQQVQALMRRAKRTATYWLSLIQYDDQLYDVAEKWFVRRALDEEQSSFWEPAARYNLARTAERLDQPERAIELYKTQGDPQEHGNRIRARLLDKAAE